MSICCAQKAITFHLDFGSEIVEQARYERNTRMGASLRKLLVLISEMNPSGHGFFAPKSQVFLQNKTLQEKHSCNRTRGYDLRVMSLSPIIAKICEKLLFPQGFQICGSNVSEEQWLTQLSITKQRISGKSF